MLRLRAFVLFAASLAACTAADSTSSTTSANTCRIGGLTFAADAIDPDNACVSCQPAIAEFEFSNRPLGTACGAGQVCSAATCESACFINDEVIRAGLASSVDSCQICDPSTSTSTWTSKSDGTPCGDGVCQGGQCKSACIIQSNVVLAGTFSPTNACQICEPRSRLDDWTIEPDGTTCANNQVCDNGSCQSGCFTSGVFRTPNTVNPENPCQVCSPNLATSGWSNVGNGTSCGTGLICDDGACSAVCFIDGQFVASGSRDPARPCETCQPTADAYAYSPTGTCPTDGG